MSFAPYPYERWPKLTRGGAALASGLARIALHAEGAPAQRMLDAATRVLGADVHVAPGPARAWRASELRSVLPDPLLAIELQVRLDGVDHGVILELTGELGGLLVERVLGGTGESVRAPGFPLDELELGALAYLAARTVAASGSALRVRSVTTERDAVLRALAAGGDGCVIAWPLELSLGDTAGSARALVPEHAGAAWLRSSPKARRFDVPSALLGLPLTLCAHAATVRLSAPELRSLEPGDVVVPERCALARGDAGWQGQASLHVIGRRGPHARCALRERALCIEAIEPGEHAMTDPESMDALVKDAPVELCVELARFTVRLEDVLGLRVGEVWSTGSPIGERVLLTANGRALARGELVDIDGEVGVRILEKHG